MKGRVILKEGVCKISTNWNEIVDKPFKEGYYIEAISAADALIDEELQTLLRIVYKSEESQDLINNLESVREETKFFGAGILKILENKEVINKQLADKIRAFKGKRNLIAHSFLGEYSLVDADECKDQEEYNNKVREEGRKVIINAREIFNELVRIMTSNTK